MLSVLGQAGVLLLQYDVLMGPCSTDGPRVVVHTAQERLHLCFASSGSVFYASAAAFLLFVCYWPCAIHVTDCHFRRQINAL